eukprot:CFRG7540T1
MNQPGALGQLIRNAIRRNGPLTTEDLMHALPAQNVVSKTWLKTKILKQMKMTGEIVMKPVNKAQQSGASQIEVDNNRTKLSSTFKWHTPEMVKKSNDTNDIESHIGEDGVLDKK